MPLFCCFNAGKLMTIVPSEPEGGGSRILASVGMGGANRRDDVIAIQTLLNLARLVVPQIGPSLAVDGIAGPKTIGAIRAFQTAQFGSADGRVDPGKRTIARLNVLGQSVPITANGSPPGGGNGSRFGLVGGPALGVGPVAAPAAPMTPLQAAIEATPRARQWVTAAITQLTALKTVILAAGGDMRLILPFAMQTVNTHFHLDRAPGSELANIDKITGVFQKILRTTDDTGKFYAEGAETAKSLFADAPMGGFDLNLKITFRTRYPTCGPNVRSAMIVHEGAHFCGGLNEINHFAFEFPAPAGQPQDGSARNYEQLTTSEAMRNASSYAAFAIHAFFFVDHRFGAGDLTK